MMSKLWSLAAGGSVALIIAGETLHEYFINVSVSLDQIGSYSYYSKTGVKESPECI